MDLKSMFDNNYIQIAFNNYVLYVSIFKIITYQMFI